MNTLGVPPHHGDVSSFVAIFDVSHLFPFIGLKKFRSEKTGYMARVPMILEIISRSEDCTD
jgi:hypothetical protein